MQGDKISRVGSRSTVCDPGTDCERGVGRRDAGPWTRGRGPCICEQTREVARGMGDRREGQALSLENGERPGTNCE